jgi:WXG100 family type VII secretion target
VGYIKVTTEELNTVAGTLNSAASQINELHAQAMAGINGLVGAGWEGAASAQAAALISQLRTAAAQTDDALAGLTQLLLNAGSTYAETEAEIVRSMSGE